MIEQFFQSPPKVGKLVPNGSVQQIDTDNYVAVEDGKVYDQHGREWDPTPQNEDQLNAVKNYKAQRKAFVANFKNPESSWYQTFLGAKDRIRKRIAESDPTAQEGATTGGDFADVVANMIKSGDILIQNNTGSSSIYDLLQTFIGISHRFRQHNVPIPNLTQFKNRRDLSKFISDIYSRLAMFQYIKDDFIAYMNRQEIGLDVSKQIKQLQAWLYKVAFKQNIHIQQDYTEVSSNVIQFKRLVRDQKIKINTRLQNHTYQSLVRAVSQFQQMLPSVQPTENGKKVLNHLKPISAVGPYKLYKTLNAQIVKELGQGTVWCTRRDMKERCRAESYLADQGGMYFVTKDDKIILQMMPAMSQFMDTQNRQVANKVVNSGDEDLKSVLVPYFRRVAAQSQIGYPHGSTQTKKILGQKHKPSIMDLNGMIQDYAQIGSGARKIAAAIDKMDMGDDYKRARKQQIAKKLASKDIESALSFCSQAKFSCISIVLKC